MTGQVGRYRIICPLGNGKMGAVYLARDPTLSRLVAVKVLHAHRLLQEEAVHRFFQEAKVVARSKSPHIVQVHDLGQVGKAPYLVMEFIDGRSLEKLMEFLDGKPLPPIVAASLVCQAAEGIAMAAEAGIVHRDLKPANLMISEQGYLKITDFGLCHLSDHTLTRTGQVMGSPRFMSPEQIQGLKPISPQADLFSLGAVLYYGLTGQAPFQAETPLDLFRQITQEPHPPLEHYVEGLDPFLVRLVDTLLQKDPAKRGQGPRWLRFQLKRFLYHKRVIDPAERVAAFTRDLSTQGFQTTSALKGSVLKQLEGSLDLEKRPSRILWNGRRLRWAVAVLILAAGTGVASLFMSKNNHAGQNKPLPPLPGKGREVPKDSSHVLRPVSDASVSPIPRAVPLPTGSVEESSPAITNTTSESSKPEPRDTMALNGSSILTIQSAPPFAEVILDGDSLGRTPLEGLECSPGRHRLILQSGYSSNVDTLITLKPGPQTLKFMLMQNPDGRQKL